MNSKIVVTALLFWTLFCAFQCNKSSDYLGDKVYTATVKASQSCARYYACVITEGDIEPDLVDNNWKLAGQTYSKAFTVGNYCTFPSNMKEGISFRFRILKNPVGNNCQVCTIGIIGQPSKSLNIEVIK